MEAIGLEEFIPDNYVDGELYVDEKRESFKKLGLKNSSYPKLLPSVFSRKSAVAMMAAVDMNIGGNVIQIIGTKIF